MAADPSGKMNPLYPSEMQITMFTPLPAIEMTVVVADDPVDATHWGWIVDGDISMCMPSAIELDTCFAVDPAIQEKAGVGLRVPLIATPVITDVTGEQ